MCLLSAGPGLRLRIEYAHSGDSGRYAWHRRGLAARLRAAGDRVIALGSADADLTSVRQTADLVGRLPDRIDVLVLAAGRFDMRRVVTAEGLEQTFAIGVVSRYLLAERLRPALAAAATPVVLNLSGTGGIKAGRIHWDDPQLTAGYTMFKATMQGARANDLLGVAFAARREPHPVHPLQPVARQQRHAPPVPAADARPRRRGRDHRGQPQWTMPRSPWSTLLDNPPDAPLTALRRGKPVSLSRPEFDAATAARFEALLPGGDRRGCSFPPREQGRRKHGNHRGLATDAGLFGLWSPTSFHDIVDYESWEDALLDDEDIVGHVVAGGFVPINIGGDGAYQFVARVGSASAPAGLTERERPYAAVTSDPYLFVATAGAVISGIEHVGDDPDIGLRVPLEPGRWAVTVALIDWAAEPGQRDEDGAPSRAPCRTSWC